MRQRVHHIGVVIVVSVALLGLAACGRTNETARAAGMVPANSIAFASVSLAPSIAQRRDLEGILSKFPYRGSKDTFQSQLDKALANAVKEDGLDYARDVKPWLGAEIAVAVLAVDPKPQVVALVKSTDDAKAQAALTKAQKSGNGGFAFKIIDHFAVLTDPSTPAALDAVAKVTDATSLAKAASFTKLEPELHGDRLVLGWADGKRGFEALQKTGRLPLPAVATDQLLGGANGTFAFDVHAERNAAVLEGVASASKAAPTGGTPSLTKGLPTSTIAAVTFFDLGKGFATAMQQLGGAGNPVLRTEQEIERQAGISLQNDLFAWMHGETVIAVDPPTTGKIPSFAIVIAPSDKTAAAAGVANLKAAIARAGVPVVAQTVAGVQASVAKAPVFAGIQPAFALFGDRFVLASSVSYLTALATPASPGLAGVDEYTHALGTSSDHIGAQFLVRAEPLRALLAGLFGPSMQSDLQKTAPLEAIGARAFVDGSFSRFDFRATFK